MDGLALGDRMGEIFAVESGMRAGHQTQSDQPSLVGEVRFGVGRRRREALEEIRLSAPSGARTVPVRPLLAAEVKFFGRHRTGAIRDGVLTSVAAVITG